MRLYLESFDLFGHADGSAEPPAETASEQVKKAFELATKKAWTYICLAVEPEQQIHVRDTHTTKEAWDCLITENHIVGGIKTIFLFLQEVDTEGCYRLAVMACDLLLR